MTCLHTSENVRASSHDHGDGTGASGRRAPHGDPGRAVGRPVPHRAGLLDHLHRPAEHRRRPARRCRGRPVGSQRICRSVRGIPGRGRPVGRSGRSSPPVRRRHCHLRDRQRDRQRGGRRNDAAHRPRRAGNRRRAAATRCARPYRDDVSGRPGAQQGAGRLGIGRRIRARRRSHPRWPAHDGVVAADVRHQRAAHAGVRGGRTRLGRRGPRPRQRRPRPGSRLGARYRDGAHAGPRANAFLRPGLDVRAHPRLPRRRGRAVSRVRPQREGIRQRADRAGPAPHAHAAHRRRGHRALHGQRRLGVLPAHPSAAGGQALHPVAGGSRVPAAGGHGYGRQHDGRPRGATARPGHRARSPDSPSRRSAWPGFPLR